MKNIAIYGAGGLGREVACIIKKINCIKQTWNVVGFFDDGLDIGDKNEYGTILGGINQLNDWKGDLSIVIAIGTPNVVEKIFNNITKKDIDYPNIVSPDLKFMDENNYTIGKGNFINLGCLLSCNTHIGNFNTIGAFSSIGHDAVIGDFNTIMPSVQICGCVKVGRQNFFGISSIVLQQNGVGNNNTLGCGSVLMKSINDDETFFGNPARGIIKKK